MLGSRPEVRAFLVRDLVAATEFASRLRNGHGLRESEEWVSDITELAVIAEIRDCVGDDELVRLARTSAKSSSSHSIAQPLLSAAMRASPDAACFLRWAPGLWAVTRRGFGTMRCEERARCARLAIKGVPRASAASLAWRIALQGRLLAGLDLLGCRGEVDLVDNIDPTFDVRW